MPLVPLSRPATSLLKGHYYFDKCKITDCPVHQKSHTDSCKLFFDGRIGETESPLHQRQRVCVYKVYVTGTMETNDYAESVQIYWVDDM